MASKPPNTQLGQSQWIGLPMSERKAVTKATATRYARSDKLEKTKILDESCETTGWGCDHARTALRTG